METLAPDPGALLTAKGANRIISRIRRPERR